MQLVNVIGLPESGKTTVALKVAQELNIPLWPTPNQLKLVQSLTVPDQAKLVLIIQQILSTQLGLAKKISELAGGVVLDINHALLEIYINKAFHERILSYAQYSQLLEENAMVESLLNGTLKQTFALIVEPAVLAKRMTQITASTITQTDIEELHKAYLAVCLSRKYELIHHEDIPYTAQLITNYLQTDETYGRSRK